MSAGCDVAIVGGGISGLSAAHYLSRRHPELRLQVFEARRRLGGIVHTVRPDGFVIEGGPDSFLSSKPRGLGLARELGMDGMLQGTNGARRRTWVMSQGRLHSLPEGLTGLVPSRLEPLLDSDLFTMDGKERLRREPFIAPRVGPEDESLASFVGRRFGREVYDRMIEPLMAGIYAGDGEELSLAATFPQLRQLESEYGSVIRGIAATRDGTPDRGRSAFLTPIGGMSALIDALADRLGGACLHTDAQVRRIAVANTGFQLVFDDDSRVKTRGVIVATSAHEGAHLLGGISRELADTLAAIPHGSSASVSLAYPASSVPRTRDGFGYVVPRIEGRPVLACTWVSSKFAHRAPDGFALVRVFIGRRGADDMLAGTDDSLIDIARQEVSDVLGTNRHPIHKRVFRWPIAMPQYTMGHVQRVASVASLVERFHGLSLAGNWMHGVGVPDCIASAERAAEDVVNDLAGKSSTV